MNVRNNVKIKNGKNVKFHLFAEANKKKRLGPYLQKEPKVYFIYYIFMISQDDQNRSIFDLYLQ
jgi:hypothetical protein